MKIVIFPLFLVIFEHVTASNSLWEENEMENCGLAINVMYSIIQLIQLVSTSEFHE